mmetsp:Transcript_48266/g.76907  ORF Transcript_48266/g.76907 Transcript_48266/m.76907 type:complete len:162 (-) Transcript_48266:65-550(-)
MTWGMHAIGFIELGDIAQAASHFNRSFANAQEPFLVWTETPTGGAVNFLTGVGGFLQTAMFGLSGLRIWDSYLALKPSLIEGMTSITLRGLHYQGSVFDFSWDQRRMCLSISAGTDLTLTDEQGQETRVVAGKSVTLPCGAVRVKASENIALPLQSTSFVI